jgi:hypothetical protein
VGFSERIYPHVQSGPLRVAAGQESGTRRRADRSRGVEVGKPEAFRRQLVDIRRVDFGRSVGPHIRIPEVIRQEKDDVGLLS